MDEEKGFGKVAVKTGWKKRDSQKQRGEIGIGKGRGGGGGGGAPPRSER